MCVDISKPNNMISYKKQILFKNSVIDVIAIKHIPSRMFHGIEISSGQVDFIRVVHKYVNDNDYMSDAYKKMLIALHKINGEQYLPGVPNTATRVYKDVHHDYVESITLSRLQLTCHIPKTEFVRAQRNIITKLRKYINAS